MRSSLIVLGLFPLISATPFTQQFLRIFTPFNGIRSPPQARPRPRPVEPSVATKQLRSQSESLINILRDLDTNPRATRTINRVFNANSNCLSNMDEAIQAIQEGTRLAEAAERDLENLNSRVKNLLKLTDEAQVVREVASILRALEPLLTKISPANPSSKICSASPDRTEAYINSLAGIMKELSEDFQINSQDREIFVEAASILSATNSFIRQLRTQTREFQNFCFPDKESATRGIRAMGEIISGLADLTATLGDVKAAEETRRGSRMTEKIVDQIQKMNDLETDIDCSVTDLNSAADTMEDLADIIEEVGINRLRNQLGIDLSFDY